MKIAVIGTGYVGLVAGACFAESGNEVICVDIDPKKVEALKRGEIPIYEPGLEDIVSRCLSEKRLSFTTSTRDAVANSEIIFLAVNTPSLPNGDPDLTFLKAASEAVARVMPGPRLVVNKSTVPIGSHEVVKVWMQALTPHSVEVASNPEFLKEGSAVDDFLKPERVIIGTKKIEVFQRLAELYAPFVRQGNAIIHTDPISAEMIKYACNSFLATRISFMNELSQLCEKVGGDIEEIRRGMATDSRIGKSFLYAGVGYGGSCFPKDIKALLTTAQKNEVPLRIVQATETANERQKCFMVEKIARHFQGELKNRKFAIWGLAFKPNTDDMRDAPSINIINGLLEAGSRISAFDPVAMPNAKKIFGDQIEYASGHYLTLKDADALVLVTEWNAFRTPDFDQIKSLLKTPLIFDGRNIFNPNQVTQKGFTYFGIGR